MDISGTRFSGGRSYMLSDYDDFGLMPWQISHQHRRENVERAIERFFVGKAELLNLEREAVMRTLNPGAEFSARLQEGMLYAEGGFGPQLLAPSPLVERAFREYAQTDLGAVAIQRLLEWDDEFIERGWREPGGALTEAGIRAYGEGMWRPLRVASSDYHPDTVTPSGTLVLPDEFVRDHYSTGDIEDPYAVIHHELKAHVLPLKEAAGLKPGKKMELICVRLESEMLNELGLPNRRLNWGRDDGFLDHTLHEASEYYFHGLVREEGGHLVEVDPGNEYVIGRARLKC